MNEFPLIKRRAVLSDLTKKPSGKTHAITIRNGREELSVYEVAIGLPKYRIENMRTRAAQREHVRKEGTPEDFFSDPDSEEVQEAQARILWETVKGSTILDILTSREQTDPLILTKDGFVVNGNRRLCTMRHLLAKDATRFARFGRVRVVVLPNDFDETEVRRLEAELQVYPDAKLDYTWFDVALSKRGLQDIGMPEAEICSLYKEDIKELRLQVGSLALAEKYLKRIDREERYSELPKGEHTFYRLYEGLHKLSKPEEREFLEQAVFTLLDDNTGVSRIYTLIPDIVKNIKAVVSAVATELSSEPQEEVATDSFINELLGEGTEESESNEVATAIASASTEQAQVIRDTIIDAIEEVRANDRAKKKSDETSQCVRSARAKLQDGLTAFGPGSKVDGLTTQLDAIDELVGKLRQAISCPKS